MEERSIRWLCVFCGSRFGNKPLYTDCARSLSRDAVGRGWGIVYGGGRVGLMGVVATEALAVGGSVVGVIPYGLAHKEIAQEDVTELILTDTMHQRKEIMSDRADAFVALPGGFGTCDETFEILTWAQLGIHRKPVGILNTAGYFDPMLSWVDHMVQEDFLKPIFRDLLIVDDEPARLLDRLSEYRPDPRLPNWVRPAER